MTSIIGRPCGSPLLVDFSYGGAGPGCCRGARRDALMTAAARLEGVALIWHAVSPGAVVRRGSRGDCPARSSPARLAVCRLERGGVEQMSRVVVGVDPHKKSVTIEAVDDRFGGCSEMPSDCAFDRIASSLRPMRMLITPADVLDLVGCPLLAGVLLWHVELPRAGGCLWHPVPTRERLNCLQRDSRAVGRGGARRSAGAVRDRSVPRTGTARRRSRSTRGRCRSVGSPVPILVRRASGGPFSALRGSVRGATSIARGWYAS
jgi:hypothetical protein